MRYFLVCYSYVTGNGAIFIMRDDGNFCDIMQAVKDGAKGKDAAPTFVFEFQNEEDFLAAQISIK